METVEEVQNQREIYPKRIKFKEIREKGKFDRISALPDCLLLEILSRLPSTKDAIRTGTFSTRWKHIWTSVPTLIFRDSDFYLSCSNFVALVDKTLTQCRQLKLKKFEVNTRYNGFESQFNNWIRYAIRFNVEELNLMIRNITFEAGFQFDQSFYINTCFTCLNLEGCMLNPSGAVIWKNLRSLSISYVNLDEDLIENILSGSPLLESLELGNCYGFRLLDITSKSVKNLVFCGYMAARLAPFDELEANIIEINAPNILSLKILGNLYYWKVLLVNVSSLVEADLDYTKLGDITPIKAEEEMLKGFILKLSHVKELRIGVFCSKVLSRLVAKGFASPSDDKFPDASYEQLELAEWFDSDSDSYESGDGEVL